MTTGPFFRTVRPTGFSTRRTDPKRSGKFHDRIENRFGFEPFQIYRRKRQNGLPHNCRIFEVGISSYFGRT